MSIRFSVALGNPPYQDDNHSQVYPGFYNGGKEIADNVAMIFPVGWQEPKDGNNLRQMNTPEVKEDRQIALIDNRKDVFPGIAGAQWTNIIIWKKGYDNGLSGNQKVLTNGENIEIRHLDHEKSSTQKPQQIQDLATIVRAFPDFESVQHITSVRKPYGLSTDVICDTNNILGTAKYGLPPLQMERKTESDLVLYCKGAQKRYIPRDYPLPRHTDNIQKYKVFVPYAWGNMSENTGLGGAFSDIILAHPGAICTESYQESGGFNTEFEAKAHAKYLLTQFARALLYLNKFSQHSTTAWGAVPIQDYHESWWNESIESINLQLMDKYQIPSDIQDYVSAMIQKKTEQNIINYTC